MLWYHLVGLIIRRDLSPRADDANLTPSKKKKKKDAGGGGGGLSGGSSSGKSKSEDAAHSKSPALDRVPLPKLSRSYVDKRKSQRHEASLLTRGTLQQQRDEASTTTTTAAGTGTGEGGLVAPTAPGTSVIFYTVCNAQAGESAFSLRRGGAPCMTFSEDLSMLASGFGSGRIRVWSLGAESLRLMLPPQELERLDMDDARIKSKMLHDENE